MIGFVPLLHQHGGLRSKNTHRMRLERSAGLVPFTTDLMGLRYTFWYFVPMDSSGVECRLSGCHATATCAVSRLKRRGLEPRFHLISANELESNQPFLIILTAA